MRCPRCGLTVTLRAAYLTLDRCPRCIAKFRISVPMVIVEAPQDQPPPESYTPAEPAPRQPSGAGPDTAAHELVIRTKRERQGLVLALDGELDLASAPLLERQLRGAEGIGIGRVVVDLSGLEFCDSAGLHVLLDADRRWRESGQDLLLRRGPKAVQRLFELTGTTSIFRFEE